jgi:hypothetical protein
MNSVNASVRARNGVLAFAMLLTIAPASAQETITYKYDGRGRLVTVDHGATGPNANVKANYTYDHADNRCNVNVGTSSTSGTCGGGSGGGTATLTLSPATLPGGIVGTSYTKTITASGGTSPYTFTTTAGALPTGLTLTTGGSLSGTPSATGTYNFTIGASDGPGDSGSRAYSVKVGVALTVSPTGLPSGTVGTAYTQTITASGGTAPYTFTKTAGTLPSGLTLTSAGTLSGTPSTAGSSSFTITATDGQGDSGNRPYTVTMTNGNPCAGVSFAVNGDTETAPTPLQFTVTKSGSTSNNCSVSYATADGDAIAPGDYTSTSGTLTFGATDISEVVGVMTHGWTDSALQKTMELDLSNPTGGATISTGSAVGTIMKPGVCPLSPSGVSSTSSSSSTVTSTDTTTTTTTSPDGSVQPMQPIC